MCIQYYTIPITPYLIEKKKHVTVMCNNPKPHTAATYCIGSIDIINSTIPCCIELCFLYVNTVTCNN